MHRRFAIVRAAMLTFAVLTVPLVAVSADRGCFLSFALPAGDYPHDVSPGPDGTVYYADQRQGALGIVDPRTGRVDKVPLGTRHGDVHYASLAGSYVGRIDIETGEATVLEPPTPGQGARRVWADSRDRIWVAEWQSGQVSVHDPGPGTWKAWKLPGRQPKAYAVYVDEQDIVWLTDWGANALVRFDPTTEQFEIFPFPREFAHVRQIHGRPGAVLIAESGPRIVSLFKK